MDTNTAGFATPPLSIDFTAPAQDLMSSPNRQLSASPTPASRWKTSPGVSATAAQVTETVYRLQIRPVMEEGATVMDNVFNHGRSNR